MTTVGKRSLKLDRALLAGLVAAMALALGSGCVASGDIDPETGEPLDTSLRSGVEENSAGHAATQTANGATTPAAPNPEEPQPSPWDPGGPAYLTGEAPSAPATSPTATPQPSPWHGFVPPPGTPNSGPSQVTSASSP